MANGIDTAENTTGAVKCLVRAGYAFVGRYYNRNNPAKNLTREEALALGDAGLFIVSVWENGFPTAPGYFTHERGLADGASACRMAAGLIGQPQGTPIYFAVDYDASPQEVETRVEAYFSGLQESFLIAGEEGSFPQYLLGAYGSGLVCGWLLDNLPSVRFAWLAQSRGWRGYSGFDRWNIRQGPGQVVCGLSADLDETRGNGGGWRLPEAAAQLPAGSETEEK